eukprot:g19592.t1
MPDMMSNGIAAWKALVKKYRNPSRQRQKVLFKKLYNMTMDVEQDPDALMHDMTELRDELQLLGSPIPDDQFLNIILDCLPEQLYSGISTTPAPTSTMTVDTGAAIHFVDSELLPDLEQRMIECNKIDPPLRITVSGQGQLPGTAKGVLKVIVTNQHDDSHPARLPFICVPNLWRHLFSGGTARKQGVSTLIGPTSFLDVGVFKIPLRPNEVLEQVVRIDSSGVVLRDSFSACGTCKIIISTQQNHPKTANTDSITRRLRLVSTDLLGPVSPTAIGGFNYMAKFTDRASRLKAVYFITEKGDALSSLVHFVQDIAIPLGLRVEYLRSDNGGEFVNSEFRLYCKTTGIVQQFSSLHTPQQNGISERDGRTIINTTSCLVNEANLPKHITATSVFLVNRLPHKALKDDTPYWRMFGKQANLSFLRIIGSRAFVHVEGQTTKLQPRA